MTGKALLAITSHGNAPYLMAGRVAKALGNRPVVIPHYYGVAQHRILMEEIPGCQKSIYLSKELGDILWPLLLDVKNGFSFAEFAERLADPSNPDGILAVEKRVNSLIEEGIPGISLDGKTTKRFQQNDFSGVLISAQPIRVHLPNQYFFFTSLLSDLYGSAPESEMDEAVTGTVERQQGFARLWKRAEDGCDLRFIPRINAFSYRENEVEGIIATPPLSFIREPMTKEQHEGVLFSPSGTGTDVDKLLALARKIPGRYQKYILPGMRKADDFPAQEFRRTTAESYADPMMKCVIARGGWGTIWECEMNAKPLLVVRTSYLEDPEMGHTQKALEHLGIAAIWEGPDDPFLNEEKLGRIQSRLFEEREKDKALFGEGARDGFGFIARKIKEFEQMKQL